MKTNYILTAVLMTGLLVVKSFAETSHRCLKLSENEVQMTLRSKDYAILRAYDTTDPIVSDCMSTLHESGYQEISIVAQMPEGTQVTPDPTSVDCYVIKKNDNEVIFNIAALASAKVVAANDKYLEVTCNITNPTFDKYVVAQEADLNLIGITKEEQPSPAVTTTLELLDENGNQLPTTVPVGTQAIARLTYEYPATTADKENAKGIQGVSLQASGNADFSSPILMLDDNGCPPDAANTPAQLLLPNGFNDNGPGSNPFILETPVFGLVAFPGSKKFYARVDAKQVFCYDTEDQCHDIVAYCAALAAGGRKRRSTGNNSANGTITASVNLYFGSGTTDTQSGTNTAGSTNEEEPFCRETYKFWIVAIVLGALLLAAMLFAIFLFFRLRKEQRHSEKMADKYGIPNPTVQA